MVQFLDPEIAEILQFLDPEIVKMDKIISGSRNCRNGAISGSRNRRKGRQILYVDTISILSLFTCNCLSIFCLYLLSFSLTLGSVLKNSIVKFTSREQETPSGKLSLQERQRLWGCYCCCGQYLSSPREHPSSLASSSLSWLCCMLMRNISSRSE